MSTNALKSIASRSLTLGVAVAVLVAVIVPTAAVFADSLNPLTERSLLLSSSAPGFQDTDGAGNAYGAPTQGIPNGSYAPAGSGANGKKSGQTFTFRMSTDTTAATGTNEPVKAFTLQYCTNAAGWCQAPGDNTGDARTPGSDRQPNSVAHPLGKSDFEVVFADNGTTLVKGTDYEIKVNDVEIADYSDWVVTAVNAEDEEHSGALTGKNNFITMSSPTGLVGLTTLDKVELTFNATETNYLTNPGSGSFFVKINSYKTSDNTTWVNTIPFTTNNNIIDGGVTVANVMTDSIHITTKVLETMSFSVGTRNRDTVTLTSPAVHGTCDVIEQNDGNRLNLGNPDAEFSLETTKAWDVYSYWRLSSNSSGGATVYYSGNTLANTVGDEIAEIGATATTSTLGTEQFGLGFVDAGDDTIDPTLAALYTSNPNRFKLPSLYALNMGAAYDNAKGTINPTGADNTTPPTAEFAFEKASNTVPRVIATNTDSVISCDTAKMRYMANIGADTPAGVYTTKINYLAAPQY